MSTKTKFLIIFLVFLIVILLAIQFFKKPAQEEPAIQPVLKQDQTEEKKKLIITSSAQGLIDATEPIKLTLSTPLSLSSIKYQLNPTTKVALALDPDGKQLIITPDPAWIFNTKYEIIINGQTINFQTIERTGI